MGAQPIQRTGFNQHLQLSLVADAVTHTVYEIIKGSKFSAPFSLGDQGLYKGTSQVFQSQKAESNILSVHVEVPIALIDVRRKDLDSHTGTLGNIFRHLIGGAEDGGKQCTVIFAGIVSLQISSPIGKHAVGGRMALIESIIGKANNLLKEIGGGRFIDSPLLCTGKEGGTLTFQNGQFLFGDGTADDVRTAKGIARHHLKDLHNLFLIDDAPVGHVEDRCQKWRCIPYPGSVAAVFHVFGDGIHRTGTV